MYTIRERLGSLEIKGFPGMGTHLDEEKYANRLAESDHIMVTIEGDFVTMVTII